MGPTIIEQVEEGLTKGVALFEYSVGNLVVRKGLDVDLVCLMAACSSPVLISSQGSSSVGAWGLVWLAEDVGGGVVDFLEVVKGHIFSKLR